MNKKQGCVPLTVNFTDSSYGGTVTKRDWDLGGLSIPNGNAAVGRNFQSPGKFTIRLTVTFSNGDVRTKIDSIVVHPLPVAAFTLKNISDTAGCAPHTVSFNSNATTATGTITQWLWDFGAGGNTGSNPTPSFTYLNPGTYNVSLIVENSWGCKSSAATELSYVTVYPPVKASFTTVSNFSCDTFLTAAFLNTTTGGGALTYYWYFGDGDSLVINAKDTVFHLYQHPGVYPVKLVAKNASNCQSTFVPTSDKYIYVGKPKPSMTTSDTVCLNTNVVLSGTSTPTAYTLKWFFSDHNSIRYSSPVNYTFDLQGTFEVQLIAYNYVGCSDTVRKNIFVKPGPTPNLTVDKAAACTVPFSPTFSVQPVIPGAIYDWDFGDGTPHSNSLYPSHSYLNPGNYTVKLKATDPVTGCSGTITKTDTIRISIPKVDFTVSPMNGCMPVKVTAKAIVTSVVTPNAVAKYRWNFGDGTISDTASPVLSHTFTHKGNYPVRLTIFTTLGCKDSSIKRTVVVDSLCDDDGSGGTNGGGGAGGFLLSKSCADKYTVTFTDTVKNCTVTKWDFGDGAIITTGILNPITHAFPTTKKEYVVTVTRLNTLTNVTETGQKRVIIIDEKANFFPDITDICKGKQVNFKTLGIDSSKINKYTWDFGDSTARLMIDNKTYYQQYGVYKNGNTNHIYNKNGTFYPKLIIEDKLGCKDSVIYSLPILVKGPVALFNAAPLTVCGSTLNVTFKDSSQQNGTVPITQCTWDFGDGKTFTTSPNNFIQHIYNSPNYYAAYNVKLKVVDSLGCESQLIKNSYIRLYNPKAGMYSYDTLKCGNLNVFLYNNSSAYNATYTWYYGDGTSSTSYHGSHTYTKDGIYTIKLVVKDENNCTDSITKPAYVKLVRPIADFSVGDTSQCAPVAISFTNQSVYSNTYQWDFGDGGTGSTDKNPAPHIYGIPGLYKVSLKIKGVSGCVDSIAKWIRVKGPIGQLFYNPSSGCAPYSFGMQIKGANIKTYEWDFGDGTPVNPVQDSIINHIYVNPGKYLPNVILTSPEGCPVNLKVKDTIIVDEIVSAFSIKPYAACGSAQVDVVNLSHTAAFSTITTTQWLWGDGTSDTNFIPSTHSYNAPGKYSVSLIARSLYGCIDTLTKTDSIQVWANPLLDIQSDSIVCLTPTSSLGANGICTSIDSILQHTWMIDTDTVGHDSDLLVNYRVTGIHQLQYSVETIHHCRASTQKPVLIDSVMAQFTMDKFRFCGNGTVQYTNQSQSGSVPLNYTWDFGDSTHYAGKDTTHSYNQPGDYRIQLIATTPNGCTDTSESSQVVTVFDQPKATISGDTLTCHPGPVNFTNKVTSADSIAEYHWWINNQLFDSSAYISPTLNAGIHTIQLCIKTAEGCVDTTFQKMIVDSIKTEFQIFQPYPCGTQDTVFFNNLSGDWSGSLQYLWIFGDGITSTDKDPWHVYPAPTASYPVGLIAKSKFGCADTFVLGQSITHYAAPNITLKAKQQLCSGEPFVLTVETQSADTIKKYYWELDSVMVDSTAGYLPFFNQAGQHTLKLNIITANGCRANQSIAITVYPLPIPAATNDTAICIGSSVPLVAHDGTSYIWSPPTGLSAANISNPVATPTASVTYQVLVKNQYGCQSKDTVSVTVDKLVLVRVDNADPICSGTSTQLLASGNTSVFEWSPAASLDNAFIHNPIASPTVSTKYMVVGKSQNSCPNDTDFVQVTVGSIPLLQVIADTATLAGKSVQLLASVTNSLPVSYQWEPPDGLSCTNCPDPVATVNTDRTYTVTVTSDLGCEAMDTVHVNTFCDDQLYIPNSFTPNSDGLNDIFYIKAPGEGIIKAMYIYNRWGEVVFEKKDFNLNDPGAGWDGKVHGDDVTNSHVFSYVIYLTCKKGLDYTVIGSVTILK